MRISRLRLLGFKSFVEPTELRIEAGLTGVVGPNGCGKSNLLEALRWVMGETSHKSMRAASMDDVIFSGTTSRPARNMAEVTMFLDNSQRLAPAQFNDADEIEITRRIEREAGSIYRVNGRDCRARDIKILFEDAATGARSPALVRQGQIGDIVNSKPEARRRILEDAAGTAGLHSRRREAELRLRAAETNLARLNDVIGGLNAQVESLKRQARQARRYKELSGEIRRAEALLLHLNWVSTQEEIIDCESRLSEVLVTLGEAVKEESRGLAQETEWSAALQPLRDDEAIRSAVLGRLQIENENFEREAERSNQRARELAARAEQFDRDSAREQNFIDEAEGIIARLARDIEDLKAAQSSEAGAADQAAREREEAETVLAATEEQIAELTAELAEARAQSRSLEAKSIEAASSVEKLKSQIADLDRQSAEISAKAPDAARLSQLTAAGQHLASSIAEAETTATFAEENLADLSERLREERDNAADARLRLNSIRTERETLTKLLVPDQSGSEPAIVDAIQVSPGFEAALGAAIGDDLEAPAAETAPVHWRVIGKSASDAALPSDIEPLIRYVKAPPELARRLSQIGIVEKEDGNRLQRHLHPGQRLVTRSGDLWRWDGFVAASEGTTAAARRLEQRNRLMAIQHEEVEASERLEELTASEQRTAHELAQAQSAEREARQQWRELQAELSRTRDALTTVERAARETESRMAAVSGARTRAKQELADAQRRLSDIVDARAQASTADISVQEQALAQAQSRALEERAIAAEMRAAQAGLARARQERETRLAQSVAEHKGWTERQANARRQIEALKSRHDETIAELETFADLPGQLEARRQELMTGLADAERARKDASDKLAEAENALRDATQGLRAIQAKVGEAREARVRIDTQLENARARNADAVHRITEALQVAPEDCLALAEVPDAAALPKHDDVDRRLTRLKADRERLGGVNLQADEDLTRIAEEVAGIETERADVEEAIAKLRGAIQQLNREGRRRLREAFEIVDGHFQRLFATLFGGGEARLEMVESEEDPLEGGLEIIARPPGKKPATLSLLSGGEQTLTALSLIFAVFLTNPSPICVLDEVDAPLDDANVDRFCTLMEAMAGETSTRFLVITHHPMTMTRMNRLFGVTMAERGVSQLVSVDLETAQTFREAS